MYVTWLWWVGQHGRVVFLLLCMYRYVSCMLLDFGKLDDMDELSSSFWLCKDMFDVFFSLWQAGQHGQVGWHGRVFFCPLNVYRYVWCIFFVWEN